MAIAAFADILVPRLLTASVQAVLLVTLVWTLCRALPRLPAAARCWLWWLVALQLVAGLVWSAPLDLPLLPAPDAAPMITTLVPAQPPVFDAFPASGPAALDGAAIPAPRVPWAGGLLALWLLGVAGMAVRTLHGLRLTRTLLREATPCADLGLLQALALAAEAHGLRAAPQVRMSSSIVSPQLVGPWRPVLLLPTHPAAALPSDELDMALTHELVHLNAATCGWAWCPRWPSTCSGSTRWRTSPCASTTSPARAPAIPRSCRARDAAHGPTASCCCASASHRAWPPASPAPRPTSPSSSGDSPCSRPAAPCPA